MPDDRVIAELTAGLEPVRRLWSPARRLALWLALGTGVGLGLVAGATRPDLRLQLAQPRFLLEIATLLILTIGIAHRALAAAVPGAETPRTDRVIAAALVVVIAILAGLPVDATAFGAIGLQAWGCAQRTLLLASLPWLGLLVAQRRGAPLRPRASAITAAAAGFALAFGFMRLACGMDEALHLVVWHACPALIGLACSMTLGATWVGRWRTRL